MDKGRREAALHGWDVSSVVVSGGGRAGLVATTLQGGGGAALQRLRLDGGGRWRAAVNREAIGHPHPLAAHRSRGEPSPALGG
jgi:hypothetical protein